MSVENIKKYLINNPNDIIKVLKATDFYNISFFDHKNEIRCAYYEGGNPTSVCINCETLQSYVFSRDIGGDLFHLIGIKNNWNINKTVNIISNILNIDENKDFKSAFIFNGIYKNIKHNKKKQNKFLPAEILNKFTFHPNIRFLHDHIDIPTQFKFKVGYDNNTNRIIVPWFNKDGKLVGITGRYNFSDLDGNPKWKAIERFSKGNYVYGLYENKEDIKNSDWVIIGESEKFVMQLYSYGYHNALALGNCNITDKQARIIKSLPVKKVIIALDEGVNIEHVMAQCEKLKGGIFNNSKEIYCLYDNDNKVMPKGSKSSPSDFGKENFEILLNNYCFRKE